MTDSISFMETDVLDNKIQLIMRQTNYTYDESKQKLQDYQYNELKVIRAFMGIPEKKETPVKSINQEIYRQIRYRLDASMSEYNKKKEYEQQN